MCKTQLIQYDILRNKNYKIIDRQLWKEDEKKNRSDKQLKRLLETNFKKQK